MQFLLKRNFSSKRKVTLSPEGRSPQGTKDLIFLFRISFFLPLFFLSFLFLINCGTENSSSEELNSIMTLRRDLAAVSTELSGILFVYDEAGQKVESKTLTFVEKDDGTVTVMVSRITLLRSTIYRFVLIFYWEGIPIAYLDTTQTTSDKDETQITYAEGDIVYGVPGDLSSEESAEFSANVSGGVLPDLDLDDDGYSNFVELRSGSDPESADSIPSSSSSDVDGDGYPADAGDCDDNDALVYPGATEYLNLVDENCDGETSALLLSQTSVAITGTSQNEKVGMVVINGGDINNDGIEDLVISNATGDAYIFYGKTDWAETTIASADVTFNGETSNPDGLSLAGKADVNGDGCDDLLIGDEAYATNTGRVYLVYGQGTGCENTETLSGNKNLNNVGNSVYGATFDAENSEDRAGCSVSLTQNYNGDAFADLLIGACTGDSTATDSGKGYLVFGGNSQASAAERSYNDLVGSLALIDIANHGDPFLYGNDMAGPSTSGIMVTTGLSFLGNVNGIDPNGENYDDFAYGAGDSDGWAVYYMGGELGSSYGRVDTTMSAAGDGNCLLDAYDGSFGSVIAPLGDVNGDGLDDFAIASPYGDYGVSDTGRIKIYYGPATPVVGNVSPDAMIEGDQLDGHLGAALGAHGADVNGDGLDDFVFSAPSWDNGTSSNVGRIYVVFGSSTPFSGQINVQDLSTSQHIQITGSDILGESGFSIALGDFNGDGLTDLAVSTPNVSLYKGRVYLVFGR